MVERQTRVHVVAWLEVEILRHSSSSVDPTAGSDDSRFWQARRARSVDQLAQVCSLDPSRPRRGQRCRIMARIDKVVIVILNLHVFCRKIVSTGLHQLLDSFLRDQVPGTD